MKKRFFYKGIFIIGGIYMRKAILMVLSLFFANVDGGRLQTKKQCAK